MYPLQAEVDSCVYLGETFFVGLSDTEELGYLGGLRKDLVPPSDLLYSEVVSDYFGPLADMFFTRVVEVVVPPQPDNEVVWLSVADLADISH